MNRCSIKTYKIDKQSLCRSFFNIVLGLRHATLLKKETPKKVFSSKFCEIFENSFIYRKPLLAALELYLLENHCSNDLPQSNFILCT